MSEQITPPTPEIITGHGEFRCGLGAIVTDWHPNAAAAQAEFDRLWLEANATNLDEDTPMNDESISLEDAVGVVHDGVELLETVESIYFETTTGRMKIETDIGSFHVQVSIDDYDKLSDEHGGHWGAHPLFGPEDWRHEVSMNETRLGYWDWVADKIEQADFEEAQG